MHFGVRALIYRARVAAMRKSHADVSTDYKHYVAISDARFEAPLVSSISARVGMHIVCDFLKRNNTVTDFNACFINYNIPRHP